ncbi:hypothetical protein AB0958_39065 [Streptomyces sp. NPDC006655]|uniref:hypothetical protein n=1 Tax=Streptomyces sp. NPDC006655 TaxID=3156898 RepID=UPI0034528BFA
MTQSSRVIGMQYKTPYFIASLAVAALLLSGCYASTDYEKYPEGRFVSTASLIRIWKSGSATLDLQKNGNFTASDIKLEYFSCSGDGVKEKGGNGTWSSGKGRQRSEVLLRFNDGCTATLWAGATNGHTVLWGEYGDDNQITKLK